VLFCAQISVGRSCFPSVTKQETCICLWVGKTEGRVCVEYVGGRVVGRRAGVCGARRSERCYTTVTQPVWRALTVLPAAHS
jgi:hypothetical protein